MTGSNRSPAPLNGGPPQWGTPEGDVHGQVLGQVAGQIPGQIPGQVPGQGPAPGYPQQRPGEALSRWAPPQQAYPQQHPQFQPPQAQPQHPGYAPAIAATHAHQNVQPQAPAPQTSYPQAPGYGHQVAPQQPYGGQQPAAPQPASFGGYTPQRDPYAAPQHSPNPAQSPAGYPAQYDRFAPPPAAHLQDAYQPPAHAQQHAPQSADPHALGFPAEPQRGYEQPQHPSFGHHQPQQQPQSYSQSGAPAGDVQSWDLAHYAPGQPLPGQPSAHPQGQHLGQPAQHYPAFDHAPHDPRFGQHAPQHGGQGAGQHAAWQGHPAHGDAAYNLDPYAQANPQHGFAPHQDHGQQGQQGYDAQNYREQDYAEQQPDQDFAYDEEPVAEKRRSPRIMMIAGALVGAIVVGGGLATAYKMIGGSGKDAGKPPLVKAATSPTKTKPSDAGGKDVAYTDKKFLNRLDGPAGASSVTAGNDVVPPAPANDPEAPKKVQTVVVNRDGTITPQMQAPVQPGPGPAPVASSGIPGMVVDGGLPVGPPGGQQRPPLRGATATSDPQPVTPVARQAPKVADLPLPKVKSADSPPPVPVKKKVAVRDDLKAGSATTTASTGGSGTFVAALISTKTREEALKTFANLHQTYPDLQDKVPDVREVDRGEKGIWQRLVVGPPGSKEAVADLCKKLKGQGLKDCWVTQY